MADNVTDPRTGQTAPRAKLSDPPTTVRAKLAQVPCARHPTAGATGRTEVLKVPSLATGLGDVILDELRRQTAVNLIVGHVRLIAQVLALPAGCLGDIVSDAGLVFDREESPPAGG